APPNRARLNRTAPNRTAPDSTAPDRIGLDRAGLSLVTDPRRLERIAHTALDVLRLGAPIARPPARPHVALLVGPDAIDDDDNRWAEWIQPVFAALLDRQIRFDLMAIPVGTRRRDADGRRRDADGRRRYAVVRTLDRAAARRPAAFVSRLEYALASEPAHVHRLTVREQNGRLAPGACLRTARTAAGDPFVVVANLTSRRRILKLRGAPALGAATDLRAGEHIAAPDLALPMAPWQVRLLVPTK
ncbi:MAG: hypothetical protein ACE5E6_11690, partial [Phycisphaerae bacterium]